MPAPLCYYSSTLEAAFSRVSYALQLHLGSEPRCQSKAWVWQGELDCVDSLEGGNLLMGRENQWPWGPLLISEGRSQSFEGPGQAHTMYHAWTMVPIAMMHLISSVLLWEPSEDISLLFCRREISGHASLESEPLACAPVSPIQWCPCRAECICAYMVCSDSEWPIYMPPSKPRE